jgi:hypothetical protein
MHHRSCVVFKSLSRGHERCVSARVVPRNAFQTAGEGHEIECDLQLGTFGNREALPGFNILFRAICKASHGGWIQLDSQAGPTRQI